MPLSVIPPTGAGVANKTADEVADPMILTQRSLALTRCLGVTARLGILGALVDAPVDINALARRFAVLPDALRDVLDVLVAANYLERSDGRYVIAPAAMHWLDPGSPTSLTTSLSYSLEQWSWWGELDQVLAGGALSTVEPDADDETGWLRRVHSQFEHARLIGDDLADAVNLPRYALSVLDLGSAHGWYAAVLCQRSPILRATVITSGTAATIGRELIWEAEMDRVVTHQTGDIFTADLGGPHDAVICMPLLQGLDHRQVITLLGRAHAALAPGGLLITLRSKRDPRARDPLLASNALLMRLVSRPDPSTPEQFGHQLTISGFGMPRVHDLPAAPELQAYIARAL